MKIKSITYSFSNDCIIFDNDYILNTYHFQDCCETNYADFSQLENTGIYNEEFDLDFPIETIDEEGFRIQAKSGYWYFIPCYSDQNGYYSTELTIQLLDDKRNVIKTYNLACEERIY